MRFWCKFGATLYATILTIFTISNGIAKTLRDNYPKGIISIQKQHSFMGAVFLWEDESIHIVNDSAFVVGEAISLPFAMAVQFVKKLSPLFTFCKNYGIMS